MKKTTLFLAIAGGLLLAVSTSRLLAADAGTQMTITGSMVCGKCTLHETKECQNVVQVQQDGKTVNYYLADNATSKAEHKAICGGDSEKVSVTGTVTEKDGKEMMTASKIEVLK